jgi:transcriptional regulator with XRE-family HTH domain
MNTALHVAMSRTGMTPAALAGKVGVDPKTVARWLGGRIPHPRHRSQVAQVLREDEDVIWSGLVKRGYDREIRAAWPTRSAVPRELWNDLVHRATFRIWCAGYTSYFLWTEVPGITPTLRNKAASGLDLRFLLGRKDSPVTRDRERIENAALSISTRIDITTAELTKIEPTPQVRHTDRHISLSVWIFDDEALVSTHLADQLGHASPTLHIRRRGPGGLFDQYANHVEHLWETAHAPAPAP